MDTDWSYCRRKQRYHYNRYVDEKQLIRVCKGLYVLEKGMVDEYALLQARSGKVLYSYGTALFLWGLSDRVPHTLDLTVPHGTNVSKIKQKAGHPEGFRLYPVFLSGFEPLAFRLGVKKPVSTGIQRIPCGLS